MLFTVAKQKRQVKEHNNENTEQELVKVRQQIAELEASKSSAITKHNLSVTDPSTLENNEPAQQALAQEMGYAPEEFQDICKWQIAWEVNHTKNLDNKNRFRVVNLGAVYDPCKEGGLDVTLTQIYLWQT